MKIVIVGGVAGGATAAARLRRLSESAEIIVFERSNHVSYANCGLPYFLGGVITREEELTLQSPQSFWSRFRVDVRVCTEAVRVDTEKKTVTVKDLRSGRTYEESFDKLILSPGAVPVGIPDTPAFAQRIFTLRTVEDTLKIRDFIEKTAPESAVLAGGGFISLELAENLQKKGIAVTVVQRPRQLMTPFDPDMASLIHTEMRKNGVKLLLGRGVEKITEENGKVQVYLGEDGYLCADMAIISLGVTPESTLAKEAGLELSVKDGIKVNEKLETSARDIYAAGDAVALPHLLTSSPSVIALAGPANKQGRIIADNIFGLDSRYRGSMGSSIIKVFSLTAACTGLSEEAAKKAGIDAESVVLSPMSHASYYPGGKVMTLKVVFEKGTFRLLGAQIVGKEGVDKRIDVIATAIYAGLKATSLKELELAYAPPFSSAKDPVNMAGFIIDNIEKGLLKQWHIKDEPSLPRDGSVTLLDTRTPEEYGSGHVDGFINIPVDELRDRIDELPKDKPVYVMCQSGVRSYIATRILEGNGFTAFNLAGGYRFYEAVKKEKEIAERSYPCGMDR